MKLLSTDHLLSLLKLGLPDEGKKVEIETAIWRLTPDEGKKDASEVEPVSTSAIEVPMLLPDEGKKAKSEHHDLSGCCAMGLCGPGRAAAVRLMNEARKAQADGRNNEAADYVRSANEAVAREGKKEIPCSGDLYHEIMDESRKSGKPWECK